MNEILAPPHRWPRHEIVGALRSLGDALARHAGKPYVIKFSSWNALFCDLLQEAFSAAPWVLIFRDPVEVGVSLLRDPPGWLRNALVDPDNAMQSPEERVARLYGAFCSAAARLDVGQGKLVPYPSLPSAAWDVVAPHFSLGSDAGHRHLIEAVAHTYAKAPRGAPREFSSDAASKQAAGTAALRDAVDAFARPALTHLETLHAR